MDVVVPPSYVEFGEPPFARNMMDEFGYEREGVSVWYGPLVKLSVILYRPQLAVLLLMKKNPLT